MTNLKPYNKWTKEEKAIYKESMKKTNWEKELDKKFINQTHWETSETGRWLHLDADYNHLKRFLRSLLSKQREELVKEDWWEKVIDIELPKILGIQSISDIKSFIRLVLSKHNQEIIKEIEWKVGTVMYTNPDGKKYRAYNADQIDKLLKSK